MMHLLTLLYTALAVDEQRHFRSSRKYVTANGAVVDDEVQEGQSQQTPTSSFKFSPSASLPLANMLSEIDAEIEELIAEGSGSAHESTGSQESENDREEDADVKARFGRLLSNVNYHDLSSFDTALAESLQHNPEGHLIGLSMPEFRVEPAEGQETFPYQSEYNIDTKTYRALKRSAYLSRNSMHIDQAVKSDYDCDLEKVWRADLQNRRKQTDSTTPRPLNLVVPLNFPEAGYWGHLMDNGFPRVMYAVNAAKQVGARLFLAIPSRELMYGWPRQSAEFAKLAFNATLIVPGHPESPAIPTHNAETRFLFTCDLPSWHEQIRWRMYLQAQGAVKSHLSQKLKTAPRHGELRGLILSRSRGTHNDKGDAGFSQKMESSLLNLGESRISTLGRATPIDRLSILSIAEQIGNANLLLGVEGSAFFHMIWLSSTPRTVIELQPIPYLIGAREGDDKGSGLHVDKWLWAHCIGANYSMATYKRGQSRVPESLNLALRKFGYNQFRTDTQTLDGLGEEFKRG